MVRALHIIVTGDVQGVGYRYFAQAHAERLGITGWIRNLRDGRVEAWAEGEEAILGRWLPHLHRGPSAARVKEILTVWEAPNGINGFEVRPTAFAPEPPGD